MTKLFDQCSLLAPFIVTEKILMQQLCKKDFDWDQELDDEDKRKWLWWIEQLALLNEIQIPRHIHVKID